MLKVNFLRFRQHARFSIALNDPLHAASIRQKLWSRILLSISALSLLALCMGCGSGDGSAIFSTSNPQVAQYVFNGRTAGTVTVEFGTTMAYGLKTAPQTIPSGGSPIYIYVAGMRATTLYHMRAVAKYSDGTTKTDDDHTFTTSKYSSVLPQITAITSPGQTPQPGIELINELGTPAAPIVATDLSGNVIWAYVPSPPLSASSLLQAPKLLPNGDFIMIIGSLPSLSPNPSGTPELIREIDLVGNTVKELTIAQLNVSLKAANYNLTLQEFHHDITPLPNGHMLVLASTIQNFVLAGETTPTQVLGDVVVDLDTNLNPVWVWNEFDHLDVNRRGWEFPDWTHSNAVVYSKDDGNILVSMRAQNWIVKVDYNNGAGTGNVLWRLGESGDFVLKGGVDPTDWFYAQHGPSFTTANTTGIFGLTAMDNGDDRMYPSGPPFIAAGTDGTPAGYSTIPVFQINETAKTATLTFDQKLPPSLYNGFGGNSEVLGNRDVSYDLCQLPSTTPASQISEFTDMENPQSVWNLQLSGSHAYRANRLPSLYPGVQW